MYADALESARKNKFTHVMYLDIDEFWIAKDQDISVKDFLKRHPGKNIFSFNWLGKTNEKPFSSIYEEDLKGRTLRQVKTLFATHLPISTVDIHNVYVPGEKYYLADGRTWDFPQYHKNASAVREPFFKNKTEDFFVVHRLYRSQKEYISLLLRGRPKRAGNIKSAFKNNRNGYISPTETKRSETIAISAFRERHTTFKKWCAKYDLLADIDAARELIIKRYNKTLDTIKMSSSTELKVLRNLLKYVDDKKALSVFNAYERKAVHGKKIEAAAHLKEAAISLEQVDLNLAYELICTAQALKPNGPHIAQKKAQYKKLLGIT